MYVEIPEITATYIYVCRSICQGPSECCQQFVCDIVRTISAQNDRRGTMSEEKRVEHSPVGKHHLANIPKATVKLHKRGSLHRKGK
jgi:hypothetical protein